MLLLTLQLFKNSIDTQEKLIFNLHSLGVSVSEVLEYWLNNCKHATKWQQNVGNVKIRGKDIHEGAVCRLCNVYIKNMY
jgi:hypothetical protein